jgi:hypothetical protein
LIDYGLPELVGHWEGLFPAAKIEREPPSLPATYPSGDPVLGEHPTALPPWHPGLVVAERDIVGRPLHPDTKGVGLTAIHLNHIIVTQPAKPKT